MNEMKFSDALKKVIDYCGDPACTDSDPELASVVELLKEELPGVEAEEAEDEIATP